MCEHKELKIFGPKREEITWTRENDTKRASQFVLFIKLRRRGLAGHVPCREERRNAQRVLSKIMTGQGIAGDSGTHKRVTVNWPKIGHEAVGWIFLVEGS